MDDACAEFIRVIPFTYASEVDANTRQHVEGILEGYRQNITILELLSLIIPNEAIDKYVRLASITQLRLALEHHIPICGDLSLFVQILFNLNRVIVDPDLQRALEVIPCKCTNKLFATPEQICWLAAYCGAGLAAAEDTWAWIKTSLSLISFIEIDAPFMELMSHYFQWIVENVGNTMDQNKWYCLYYLSKVCHLFINEHTRPVYIGLTISILQSVSDQPGFPIHYEYLTSLEELCIPDPESMAEILRIMKVLVEQQAPGPETDTLISVFIKLFCSFLKEVEIPPEFFLDFFNTFVCSSFAVPEITDEEEFLYTVCQDASWCTRTSAAFTFCKYLPLGYRVIALQYLLPLLETATERLYLSIFNCISAITTEANTSEGFPFGMIINNYVVRGFAAVSYESVGSLRFLSCMPANDPYCINDVPNEARELIFNSIGTCITSPSSVFRHLGLSALCRCLDVGMFPAEMINIGTILQAVVFNSKEYDTSDNAPIFAGIIKHYVDKVPEESVSTLIQETWLIFLQYSAADTSDKTGMNVGEILSSLRTILDKHASEEICHQLFASLCTYVSCPDYADVIDRVADELIVFAYTIAANTADPALLIHMPDFIKQVMMILEQIDCIFIEDEYIWKILIRVLCCIPDPSVLQPLLQSAKDILEKLIEAEDFSSSEFFEALFIRFQMPLVDDFADAVAGCIASAEDLADDLVATITAAMIINNPAKWLQCAKLEPAAHCLTFYRALVTLKQLGAITDEQIGQCVQERLAMHERTIQEELEDVNQYMIDIEIYPKLEVLFAQLGIQ